MTAPSEPGTVTVDPASAGQRLDVFLSARLSAASRSQVQQAVESGSVLLNGRPAKSGAKLKPGDLVRYAILDTPSDSPQPQDIPLRVVYEDDDLVVIDKRAGMVVHPSAGHEAGTLVNALLARYPQLPGQSGERPGIVHRLDKDTSGLMLVARTEQSLRYLQDQLRERRVLKEYLLLCCGALDPPEATIRGRIGRHPRDPMRMAVVSTGREATTEYRTLSYRHPHTLALARLHTGRTHQIRVHFASIGHPLAGDTLYGNCSAPDLRRQFLHSARLALRLPGGVFREWRSPLPSDLQRTLALCGFAPDADQPHRDE